MSKTLHYVFDPLCGWCYGAGAVVSRLAAQPAAQLRLLPSGLFADASARRMDDQFASYAWANDQRIQKLTGQPFSERYRSEVLADRGQAFDSGPATLALTAVAVTAPRRELEALGAIQHARYVDGRDITRADTLADVLRTLGLEEAATRLAKRDAELLDAYHARIAQARALMQQFHAQGVPAFILEEDGRREMLDGGAVFSNPQAFLGQFAAS